MLSLRSLSRTAGAAGAALFLHSLTAASALAQFGGPVPAIPGGGTDIRASITDVLNTVLNYLALLAVIFVVVGGIRILASGGNDESVTKGRKTIIYAIVGLLVVFFAKAIVIFFTTL